MEFKSVSWIERNYKKIDFLGAFLITIICCLWFFMSDRSADIAFFASVVYTFVFYLISSFSRVISSKISSSFVKRFEIYKNYKRTEEVLRTLNKLEDGEPINTDQKVIWSLCLFDKPGSLVNEKTLIRKIGIKYNRDFLESEQKFREAFKEIRNLLDERIKAFVLAEGIKSKTPFFIVDEKTFFVPEEWCKDNFDDYQCVLEEINNLFEEKKDLVEIILDSIEKIRNYYSTSLDKCRKAIKLLEKVYGNQLIEYLDEEEWRSNDVETIKEAISGLESSVSDKLAELQESIDSLNDKCNDLNETIDKLSGFLEEGL